MAIFDDYGNPLVNDNGSDWSPDAAPTDSTPDFGADYFTGPDGASADPINTYTGDIWNSLSQFITQQGATFDTMSPSSDSSGVVKAPEGGSSIGKMLDSFKSTIGWDSMGDKTKAATITAGAGLIAGIGKGYSDAKTRELQQQKINTDRLLAESQTKINERKMANQDFSKLQFNQPAKGLVFSPAALTPADKRRTA